LYWRKEACWNVFHEHHICEHKLFLIAALGSIFHLNAHLSGSCELFSSFWPAGWLWTFVLWDTHLINAYFMLITWQSLCLAWEIKRGALSWTSWLHRPLALP
jgi:hypothetical protein